MELLPNRDKLVFMETPRRPAAALSVITVTPGGYETCRKCIGYLCKQTTKEKIELIIAAPSRDGLGLPQQDLACFHSHRVLEVGPVESTGMAWALAVRAAEAPVVAYIEEHTYPRPDWAQVLIDTHRDTSLAAVGFAMGNANPQTLTSWAHMYGQFGVAVEPAPSGPARALGGHHVSYRRDVLLGYGDQLPRMLSNECALFIDLIEKGHKLHMAGDAVTDHVHISRFGTYCLLDFLGQRGFAATRANIGRWSFLRRVFYITASPLIPLVRMRRILRDIYRTRRNRNLLPQVLFVIAPALACGAVGEAVGYLLGAGRGVDRRRLPIELNRQAYLSEKLGE